MIPVGIAVIGVAVVGWVLVSISNPTIDMWWPHAIRPIIPITNNAINIESLPGIKHWTYLGSVSLIDPEDGMIGIYASGCPRDQDRCWGSKRSPPLDGSKRDVLECLS